MPSWTRSSIRLTKPLRLEIYNNIESKENSIPFKEEPSEDRQGNGDEPTAKEPCLSSEDIETGNEPSGSEDTEQVTQ